MINSPSSESSMYSVELVCEITNASGFRKGLNYNLGHTASMGYLIGGDQILVETLHCSGNGSYSTSRRFVWYGRYCSGRVDIIIRTIDNWIHRNLKQPLNNTTTYHLVDTDPTPKRETQINKTLKELQNLQTVSYEKWWRMISSGLTSQYSAQYQSYPSKVVSWKQSFPWASAQFDPVTLRMSETAGNSIKLLYE